MTSSHKNYNTYDEFLIYEILPCSLHWKFLTLIAQDELAELADEDVLAEHQPLWKASEVVLHSPEADQVNGRADLEELQSATGYTQSHK